MSNTSGATAAPLTSPDAHFLTALTDLDVRAAFLAIYPALVGAVEIVGLASDPDRVERHPAIAERIAVLFNAVRSRRFGALVLPARAKLCRANVRSPAMLNSSTAHEAACFALAKFVEGFESAAVPGAYLRRRSGVAPVPDLTHGLIVRRRHPLAAFGRGAEASRLDALIGEVEREAVIASSFTAPSVPPQPQAATDHDEPGCDRRLVGRPAIIGAWLRVAEMDQDRLGPRWKKIKRLNKDHGGPIRIGSTGKRPSVMLAELERFAVDPIGWATRRLRAAG